MTATVTSLTVIDAGENFRVDVDDVLEGAKGNGLTDVAVVGVYPNGDIFLASSGNNFDLIRLLEHGKHTLIFGAED